MVVTPLMADGDALVAPKLIWKMKYNVDEVHV